MGAAGSARALGRSTPCWRHAGRRSALVANGLAERRPHATDGRRALSLVLQLPEGRDARFEFSIESSCTVFEARVSVRCLFRTTCVTAVLKSSLRFVVPHPEWRQHESDHVRSGRRLNRRAFVAIAFSVTGLALPVTGFVDHVLSGLDPRCRLQCGSVTHWTCALLFIGFVAWHVALNRNAYRRHIAEVSGGLLFSPKSVLRPPR